jgi:hypothetical protein
MTLTSARPLLFLLSFSFLPTSAFGQQDYVSRFDAYAGFAYFESPAINLPERGFHLQAGYNWKPWLAMGFDYSHADGDFPLIANYLPTPLANEVNMLFSGLESAGLLPPNYNASVYTTVQTQTFASGPSLVIRHFKHFAILLHPSLGAVHEIATPHPADPIQSTLVTQLIPGKNTMDWQGFYGIGGGLDIGVTRHLGVRMQTDVVWDHLFDDILRNGRWTIRASIGPSFHFGKNIAR